MIAREVTPSEHLIIKAVARRWLDLDENESFNLALSRAADGCGVSYERAEQLAGRAYVPGEPDWLFPNGGRGLNPEPVAASLQGCVPSG